MSYTVHATDSLREQFADVRRGELTPFYSILCSDAPFREWVQTQRNLADDDALSSYLLGLGASSNVEWYDLAQEFLRREAATFPLAPEPAPEPEPETRQAQARAIAVMRRREQEARATTERVQAQYTRLQTRVNSLMSDLLQEAEERDWCDEYDRFAEQYEDIGMRIRETESDVTVNVTLSFTRTVTHLASQEPGDAVDKSTVVQWVTEFDYGMADYAVDNWEIEA